MAHGGADKLHKPGVLKSMAEVLEVRSWREVTYVGSALSVIVDYA